MRHPVHPLRGFDSASSGFTTFLFPKHPEHVSSRRGVSRIAMNGAWICRTFSPVSISVDAKRPLPMPSGAGAGVVFVVTPGREMSVDIVDGIKVGVH